MNNPASTLVVRVQSGVSKTRAQQEVWERAIDDVTTIVDIAVDDIAELRNVLQDTPADVVVFCEDRLAFSAETLRATVDAARTVGLAGVWSPNVGGQLRLEERPKSARVDQLMAYLGRASKVAWKPLDDALVDPAVFAIRTDVLRAHDLVDVRYGHVSMTLLDLVTRLRKSGQKAVAAAGSVAVGAEREEEESSAWLVARRTDWLRFLRMHADAPAKVGIKTSRSGATLSIAMIVKDESKHIQQALRSVAGIADEVVVYDTGSTDDTRELARAAGAKVIEGYWDDDFARARNASIDGCTSEWVMFVDADDVICADEATFLAQLRVVSREFDVLLFPCNNLEGHQVAPIINAQSWDSPRVFRRKRAQFRDRIHEQIVHREGQRELKGARVEFIRLLHTGYISEVIAERGKLDRNARIGEQEMGESSAAPGSREYGLARAALGNGDVDGALKHLAVSVQRAESLKVQRLSLREGIDILTQQGRIAEAREWLSQLERCHPDPAVFTFLTGLVLLNEKQYAAAIALLEPLGEAVQDGASYSAGSIAEVRAKAKLVVGDYAGAADDFFKGVKSDPSRAGLWEYVLGLWRTQDRDLRLIAEVVPLEFAMSVATEIVKHDTENFEPWLEAMWQVHGADTRLLALATSYGRFFAPERALEWSARLLAAGVTDRLPLLEVANNTQREVNDRLRAAAYASLATGSEETLVLFRQIAGIVLPKHVGPLFDELCMISPALAEPFVLGVSIDAHRCEVMAEELERRDNADVAAEIRAFGETLRVSSV